MKTDKTNLDLLKFAYLENIATIALAGFLCWLFHNGWGCLVLANLYTKFSTGGKEENE